MNRIVFIFIMCFGLAGCAHTTSNVPTTNADGQTLDTINHSGTQLSGIDNNGTMTVYIGSQVPAKTAEAEIPGPAEATEPGIKEHEGLSLRLYADQGGKGHIGYGRNLTDKGISKEEAEILFKNDMAEVITDLSLNIFPKAWPTLPGEIKTVLIDMRFQLGPAGFRGFVNMIPAVKRLDWQAMAIEMETSLWYKQTHERSESLIKTVKSFNRERNCDGE